MSGGDRSGDRADVGRRVGDATPCPTWRITPAICLHPRHVPLCTATAQGTDCSDCGVRTFCIPPECSVACSERAQCAPRGAQIAVVRFELPPLRAGSTSSHDGVPS